MCTVISMLNDLKAIRDNPNNFNSKMILLPDIQMIVVKKKIVNTIWVKFEKIFSTKPLENNLNASHKTFNRSFMEFAKHC